MPLAVPAIVVGAVVPGIFWFWFYTRGRAYRPNPRRWLVATFLLGAISTAPAAFLEWIAMPEDVELFRSITTIAAAMLFIVGPVEELSKFLAVRLGVARTHHVVEPLDALIYGAAASLGFASAENVVYALAYGPEVLVVRGVFSTLAHLVFGSIWALTLVRREPTRLGRFWPMVGLAAAASLHGTFNILVLSGWLPGIPIALGMVLAGAFLVSRIFRRSRHASRYRLRRNVPMTRCRSCRATRSLGAAYCSQCGAPTDAAQDAVICGFCRTEVSPGAKFCGNCGDLLVTRSR